MRDRPICVGILSTAADLLLPLLSQIETGCCRLVCRLNCCWPSPAQSFLFWISWQYFSGRTEERTLRERVRVTLRLAVYRQSSSSWRQAAWDSRLAFFFSTEQRSHSQVRIPRNSWPHFTVSDSRSPPPNLEGQVPVFISSRNRMVQFYPPELGSLFIAPYDSQGYGGGIRPRVHTG
jgi:hypothetical protein